MTYSSSLSQRRSEVFRRHSNAVSFQERVKTIGPVTNMVLLIVLLCLLGLLYLTQATKTNTYGYQLDSLQKQQDSLKSEKSELEIASARMQSLDRVQSSQVTAQMTQVAPTAMVTN